MDTAKKVLFGIIGVLVFLLVLEYFLLTHKDEITMELPKTTVPHLKGKPSEDD